MRTAEELAQQLGRMDGKGYRAYCLGDAQHHDALDYLNQLGELSLNLTALQESVNTQTGDLDEFFEFLVDDITPNGMSPDELMEAIELAPPSTASLLAMDLPRSLRSR